MNGRSRILETVRGHQLERTPLPTLDQDWIQFPDQSAQFATVLESVGGKCISVATEADINGHLAELPQYVSAEVTCSMIDSVGQSTVYPEELEDPHDLLAVDFAVLRGDLAVAENGAVWLTDETLRHRALCFITQHLALVVRRSRLVSNMHEAYRYLSFTERQFGAFISGPSKTADIEQSLVIGAQGPRSHVVFLVDDTD